MNTWEQLREEGRAQGRAEVLIRQLGIRFGPLAASVIDQVRSASPEQLHRWAERILTAPTLAEVFADE